MPRLTTAGLLAPLLLAGAAAAGISGASPAAPQGVPAGEWRYYGADAGSTKYSALDQINAENVSDLEVVWRWKSQNFGPRPDFNWQVTPLMIDGVLHFTAGTRRDAVAVDAATGETLWMFRLDEGERGARAVRNVNRGLAYWSDAAGDDRILLISPGYQLVALEARTGRPIPTFGRDGVVDLTEGLDRPVVEPGRIGASSPAIVVRDTVVVGAALAAGTAPVSKANVPGYVRGFDVRTGKKRWTFRTIPRAGEFGYDTWENGSAEYTGNAGAWAPLSGDQALGYVYIPVEMPTGDFYGGHRHGDNLFADSLVCLDATTGERIWHFQLVHHDVWDYDISSPPILLDVTVDGRPVKAVAQPTKQGFLFVFNRETGEPVWPIEERPVPQSAAPGERSAPTQPFPTKPAPFERQGVTTEDLLDYTPALRAEAERIASDYLMGPLYTPPILRGTDGKDATLLLPHHAGGANWPGGAADPETGIVYVASATWADGLSLIPADASRTDMGYVGRALMRNLVGPQGLPLVKGPWGRITAIDLNTGDHVWTIPNGDAPDYVTAHPALQGIDLGPTGRPERAPLMVTKTLLFSADGSGLFNAGPGAGGNRFRAIDKKTGRVVHEMPLPASATGIPMTYLVNGKQYIVLAIGAAGFPAELVALALP